MTECKRCGEEFQMQMGCFVCAKVVCLRCQCDGFVCMGMHDMVCKVICDACGIGRQKRCSSCNKPMCEECWQKFDSCNECLPRISEVYHFTRRWLRARPSMQEFQSVINGKMGDLLVHTGDTFLSSLVAEFLPEHLDWYLSHYSKPGEYRDLGINKPSRLSKSRPMEVALDEYPPDPSRYDEKPKVLRILLRHGANPTLKDVKGGMNAFQIAEDWITYARNYPTRPSHLDKACLKILKEHVHKGLGKNLAISHSETTESINA